MDEVKLSLSLKQAREKSALTLRQVEARTGISNPYVSQLENGKVLEPTPTVLYKLAVCYGISYGDLLEAAGYPVPEMKGADDEYRRLLRENRELKRKIEKAVRILED